MIPQTRLRKNHRHFRRIFPSLGAFFTSSRHPPPLMSCPPLPLLPGDQILLWDRLPVVRLPASLRKTMLHYNSLSADASPAFLRLHFGKTDVAHPSLGLEAAGTGTGVITPSPAGGWRAGRVSTNFTSGNGGGGGDFTMRAPASLPEARKNAMFLLRAASSGLGTETFDQLIGLPLLPLADGSLGRFLAPPRQSGPSADGRESARENTTVFVCSRAERRLLAGKGLGGEGRGAGRRLLEDLDELGNREAKVLLNNRRVHAATNVAVMEPGDLAGMLGAVFPEAWQGLTQVAWAPGSGDVSVLPQPVLPRALLTGDTPGDSRPHRKQPAATFRGLSVFTLLLQGVD